MATFGSWEQTVLEHCYDTVDYVSLHAYYEEIEGDAARFLASAINMDHFIDSLVATADAVGAKLKSRKKINLSFDEWIVWYQRRFSSDGPKSANAAWDPAPRLIEDEYTVTDAVVVGTLLNSLLRHGDRVKVACQAQLINVIGLLRSEPGGAACNRGLVEAADLTAHFSRMGASAVINATTLHARGQQDRHATNLNDHAAVIPHASAPTRWQRASCRPICRHCRGPCWSLMSPEAPLVDNDARGS